MAYFDSPKNRVMWDVELGKLRKEKADFAAGKQKDRKEKARTSRETEIGHRKPVTLAQLEKEEAMETGAKKKDRKTEMSKKADSMEKKREPPSLQKKAPVKER